MQAGREVRVIVLPKEVDDIRRRCCPRDRQADRARADLSRPDQGDGGARVAGDRGGPLRLVTRDHDWQRSPPGAARRRLTRRRAHREDETARRHDATTATTATTAPAASHAGRRSTTPPTWTAGRTPARSSGPRSPTRRTPARQGPPGARRRSGRRAAARADALQPARTGPPARLAGPGHRPVGPPGSAELGSAGPIAHDARDGIRREGAVLDGPGSTGWRPRCGATTLALTASLSAGGGTGHRDEGRDERAGATGAGAQEGQQREQLPHADARLRPGDQAARSGVRPPDAGSTSPCGCTAAAPRRRIRSR